MAKNSMTDGKIIAVIAIPAGVILLAGVLLVLNLTHPADSPKEAATTNLPNEQSIPKAATAVSPTTDRSALELAKLRAENQAMREELAKKQEALVRQTPAPQPKPENPTPPPPLVGTVSGSAWINKEDGSSNMQRGLKIALLRPTVDRHVLADCLTLAAADWQKSIDEDLANIAEKGTGEEVQKFYEESVKSKKVGLEAIKAAIQSLPDRLDLQEAMALIKKLTYTYDRAAHDSHVRAKILELRNQGSRRSAEFLELLTSYSSQVRNGVPQFGPVVVECSVKESRTDADGKYRMDDVPLGDYYVHAVIDTKVFFDEWVIPVHVDGKKITKQDIFNDNAAVMQNWP